MIVVDTSALVSLLRGDDSYGAVALRELEATGTPFLIPTLCCQEILQGAAEEREWDLLRAYLSTQRMLRLEGLWRVHEEAARIFFDCRRAGHTPRSLVDCLIAQQVLDIDGILLHEDRDYEKIRAVRPLRTMTGDVTG